MRTGFGGVGFAWLVWPLVVVLYWQGLVCWLALTGSFRSGRWAAAGLPQGKQLIPPGAAVFATASWRIRRGLRTAARQGLDALNTNGSQPGASERGP